MNWKEYIIDKLNRYKKINKNYIKFHEHAKDRAEEYDISTDDIINKLKNRKIIEAYPNPYPRRKKHGKVESYLITIPKSSKYHVELVTYLEIDKILIATLYKKDIKKYEKVEKYDNTISKRF